jgi:hypothetical protein
MSNAYDCELFSNTSYTIHTIIFTLMNRQSNIIQYHFYTLSITILRCVISVVSCNYYISVYYVHTYNTFSQKTQQKLVLLYVLYYSIKSNDMFRPL